MTPCITWRDCAPLARRCVPVAYSRCGHRDQTWISLGDFARLVLMWMRLGCAPMDRAAARGMLFGSRAMPIMGIRRSTFDDSSAHFRRQNVQVDGPAELAVPQDACDGVCGANCRVALLRKLPYLTWSAERTRHSVSVASSGDVEWAVTKTTTASPRAAAVIMTIKILTTVHPEFGQIFRVRAPRRRAALPLLRRSLALPAKALVPLRCTRRTRDSVLSVRITGARMSSSTRRH